MAATAPANRDGKIFVMLTPAVLLVAWINQATAWWAAPWLAPQRDPARRLLIRMISE
jgi:hypothetical protein